MPVFTPAITFSVKLPEFEASVSGYDPLKEIQESVEVVYSAEVSIAAVRGLSSGLTVTARGVAVVTIAELEAVYGKKYATLTTQQFHRQVLKLAREKAETQIKAAAAALYKESTS